jgi:carbamoyl-phosphate synthase large subunit
MDKKKVLVTGIGGNVGQGIIRNIRKSYPAIHITGVNVTAFSAGNHLCDTFYCVPFAYEENYISTLQSICAKESIDLIIPSTDYEVYYLSIHEKDFSATIAVSGKSAAEIYLDKFFSFQHHQQNKIPFASSFLPSEYKGQFAECIAKPRKGRGSRGLLINPTSWNTLPDTEYMIQELHIGEEITTAFYVDKNKQLHGFITLLRFLDNGATTQCKVVFEYDHSIRPILESMIQDSDIRGAANLQSIVTADGAIHPFEVNCRISGTNSIRSNFGFEDVKYTIQEYLFNEPLSTPQIINGVAVRILMDVIYQNQSGFEDCKDNNTEFHLF